MSYLLSLICGSIFGVIIKYTRNYFLIIPFFIVLIILFIFFRKKSFLAVLTMLFFFFISRFEYNLPSEINGKIILIEKGNNYDIVRYKTHKFVTYDTQEYEQYSIIEIKGKTIKLEINRSKYVSSFNDYLYKKGISYSLKIDESKVRFKGDTFTPKIKKYLLSNLSDDSRDMINMIILGNKASEAQLYNQLSNLSLVHLFVISGFHINIFERFIKKVLRKKESSLLTVLLLFPYCYLVGFTIPILRAILVKILGIINDKKKLYFSSLDILLFTCLLMIFINYHLVLSTSFQLTFLTNLILILFNYFKVDSKLKKYLYLPGIIYLTILPIIINMKYEISLFGFLFSPFLTGSMIILLTLSLLTSLFKIFDPFLKGFITIFKWTINKLSGINFMLIMGKMNEYTIFIYYVILIMLLYFIFIKFKRNYFLCLSTLILILAIQYLNPYLFKEEKTIFIDVGQGDCTLIMGKNSSYNVLIDTGGNMNFDISTRTTIPLFKALGVKRIDSVFITHDDFDHNGGLESLKSNFKVNVVVEAWKINHYKIKDFEIENINHYYRDNSEDNDKSAVLFYEQNEKKFLIMGDAPISVEESIISTTNLTVDYLRIGHHGSKTSTSDKFIKFIKPELAIISVGKNYYGHPNKDVLEILSKNHVPYLRTDYDSNICINSRGIIPKY